MGNELDATERLSVMAAMGRIFGMMLRPTAQGDAAEYERCRAAILDILEPPMSPFGHVSIGDSPTPNYIRDRRRGAKGG